MRKIILNLAMSLDGLIEGPNGEFDWCFNDQDYGLTEFVQSIDAVIFGRKSYEVLVKLEPNAFPDQMKYIFSSSLVTAAPKTQVISGDVAEEVNRIKNMDGKDIWLFGGAALVTSFLQHNLIDEMQLAVHPLVLGKGKPLFTDIDHRVNFNLLDVKKYSSGLVQTFYTRK